MELYQEILLHALCTIAPEFDAGQIVESACYQTLRKIRAVLDDDTLNDAACFQKMEAIVGALESIGIRSSRHDFG